MKKGTNIFSLFAGIFLLFALFQGLLSIDSFRIFFIELLTEVAKLAFIVGAFIALALFFFFAQKR